eukprot:COSAG01_NODE_16_length_40091_cov_15.728646_13_plen_94_part_00
MDLLDTRAGRRRQLLEHYFFDIGHHHHARQAPPGDEEPPPPPPPGEDRAGACDAAGPQVGGKYPPCAACFAWMTTTDALATKLRRNSPRGRLR